MRRHADIAAPADYYCFVFISHFDYDLFIYKRFRYFLLLLPLIPEHYHCDTPYFLYAIADTLIHITRRLMRFIEALPRYYMP